MPRKKTWIRVEGAVALSTIGTLAQRGVFYNGAGYFQCETVLAADQAVATLREAGQTVERCPKPEGKKLTREAATLIAASVEMPKRWTI